MLDTRNLRKDTKNLMQQFGLLVTSYHILNVLKYFAVCNVNNANWIH